MLPAAFSISAWDDQSTAAAAALHTVDISVVRMNTSQTSYTSHTLIESAYTTSLKANQSLWVV